MKNGEFEVGELSHIIQTSGITYSQLSSLLGENVYPQNIHQWVTFKRPIPSKYHKKLSEILLDAFDDKTIQIEESVEKLNKYLEEKCKTN